MTLLPTILVIIPFLLLIILLFWGKKKLVWVSLILLTFVGIVAGFYWKMYPFFILGSIEKGFFVALDIFFIIFGAIFFLEILKEIKIVENIGFYLESISKDLRVQVILLAWFFENLLEGTAGFGTPATVVAPLLVGLGITPINAVIISLLGNSSAGIFGAAGAPIKIGFGELAGAGLPLTASLINSVGILIPVFMLWFLTKNKIDGRKSFFGALPFALWSGAAFIIPSILVVPFGQEFPSILGSILGFVIVLISIKTGFLVPKSETDFIDRKSSNAGLPLKRVLFPYVLLVILLIAGKFILGSNGIDIPIPVKHTFAFFNPGFVFVLTGLVVSFIYRVRSDICKRSLKLAFKKSLNPFLVIAFMSSMAQIMVNSFHNSVGLVSMIDLLAVNVKNVFLPLWAPIAGAFGSFLTGSVTISNLMFGNLLATAAKDLSFNINSILALALVGGAIGNMVALADILVAEAVVGIKHKEREVIKGVIVPCLICLGLVGLVGMIVF